MWPNGWGVAGLVWGLRVGRVSDRRSIDRQIAS